MKLPRAATCLLFVFLFSCGKSTVKSPVLGEAFVGPTSLNIRQELSSKAAVTATVKHGDKLEILEYKRRFVRVRTPQGAEGWADTHLLLVPQQMADLRRMADNAAKAASQGAASAYEPLNMHTEANRASPSFWQIPEGAKVDVIDHRLTPRTQAAQVSSPVAPPRPVRPPRRRGKEKSQSKTPPPPAPPAPKPPENWLELSVPKEKYEQVVHNGLAAHQELQLAPGIYNIRVGVLDDGNKKIGTLDIPLRVNEVGKTSQK